MDKWVVSTKQGYVIYISPKVASELTAILGENKRGNVMIETLDSSGNPGQSYVLSLAEIASPTPVTAEEYVKMCKMNHRQWKCIGGNVHSPNGVCECQRLPESNQISRPDLQVAQDMYQHKAYRAFFHHHFNNPSLRPKLKDKEYSKKWLTDWLEKQDIV